MKSFLKILFFLLPCSVVHGQTGNKKDTLYYSFYIKAILYDNHIYTSADTGIFDVTSNICKPPQWALSFKQDGIKFYQDGWIVQINIVRIDYPSSNLMQAQDISVWVKPKNQIGQSAASPSLMGIYSFSNQMHLGSFKKGIKYIIDTLQYHCGDHYLKLDEINRNVIENTCHINSSQMVRGHPFDFQSRNKIDSVLKYIDSTLKSNNELAEINRGKKKEMKELKFQCLDTITYKIEYWPEKHKFKRYEFDEGGNITRIITYEYPIIFFYRTCTWDWEHDDRHCRWHFVGRKMNVQVQVIKE